MQSLSQKFSNGKTAIYIFVLAAMICLVCPVELRGQATLKGSVVDESGSPVEGANVWIQTAAQKKGKGYL